MNDLIFNQGKYWRITHIGLSWTILYSVLPHVMMQVSLGTATTSQRANNGVHIEIQNRFVEETLQAASAINANQ